MPFWTRKKEKQERGRQNIAVRGFAAATTDRLLAAWRYDGGFTPFEVSANLETIRARSRQMAKDNAHMRRWLSLVETNVVGEGFSLKSTPHDIYPNKIVLDESAAKFIEYHWWRFCTYRDPETHATWFDSSGKKTEPEMDRLNAKTWARDGEYFMMVSPGNNPYGISFKVIRPDLCDHTYNVADTGKGTLIHAGVEKRITDRVPVAYWFYANPTSAVATNFYGKPIIRIDARKIIHGFTQQDEDQPRGIPLAHATLVKLKMLDEYDKAELTAAREEACTIGEYTAKENPNDEDFLDLTDKENAAVAGALTQTKQPGQIDITPRGYEFNLHTPQHPNREVTAFKNSYLRDIATGFGVEYANFANDWAGVNFSSVRAGTISERDTWKVMQQEMIFQCKQVQFLIWLKSFLTYNVSGGLPLSKLEKFSEHEFRGRRWMWVDPVKDMNAAAMAVANGWKTNTDISADMGTDYGDNLETLEREATNRDKHGFGRVQQINYIPDGSQQTDGGQNA